ncbi:P-loop containing nucleoside triphosphate hydrolase protein [Venturia nashicola]|nr:P-loop containing nucleoside triphosphate hydrolase protein [Venturia nashicola]
MPTVPCTELLDSHFGPVAKCTQFDFTLAFEQAIFGIGISALFLLWLPIKLRSLYGASIRSESSAIHKAKIGLSLPIVALQLANLVLWSKNPITEVAVASAVLGFLDAVAISFLSVAEYQRGIRPSRTTATYLLGSILADCVVTRTLYIRNYVPTIAAITSAILACKFLYLLLESWPKTRYLLPMSPIPGRVDVAGPFSRAFMWWLNPMLVRGYSNILSLADVYPLDHDMYSEILRERMEKCWEKYKTKKSYPMVWAGAACLMWPLLITIPPRAAMMALSYAQTFLINDCIVYLETPAQFRDVRHAYGLIGAAALIYTGTALLSTSYMYKVFRMNTMFRGAVASLIYAKALVADSNHNNMAAVTLMSTDVDRIAMSLVQSTEIWAQITQIAIGIWLLWRQLGPTAVAPTLLAIICFVIQSVLSQRMGPSQAAWVKAVARRIGVTSSILRSMKSVKLAGLATSMGELLQAERVHELKMALKFRWLMVITQAFSSMPMLLSPLLVFAAYSIEAKVRGTPPLSTAKAFTSLSILSLLTMPAMQLLMSFPQLVQASGCIKRIEKFLLAKGYDDERSPFGSGRSSDVSKKEKGHTWSNEKKRFTVSSTESSELALSVSELVVAPSPDSPQTQQPVSFTVRKGTMTMISGPVGSGKSTILKAVLGELSPKSGTIDITSSYIGFCAQSPWLPNDTIRQIIIGIAEFDREWYRYIVKTCCLEEDLVQMPQKDLTLIGSRGITLSGGQKHRCALARALYSRASVLVLDDFLSTVDRRTQRIIMHNLLSKDLGYVTKQECAVLFVTHITNYMHLADTLVVLDSNGAQLYSGPANTWIEKHEDLAKSQDKELPDTSSAISSPEAFEGDSFKQVLKPVAEDDPETIKRQKGDLGVWKYYGKSIGFLAILFFILCICINTFCTQFQKLWLQWNTGKSNPSLGMFLGLYAMFAVVGFFFQLGTLGQVFLKMGPQSAKVLHRVLVKATVRAPMSFFEAVDSSVLLNRFSQDMTQVDFALPVSAFMVFSQLASCIMSIALISVGSSYMAASIPVAIFALYWIQRFYLRTSRQLRHLDLESKTPLYQQFTETLEGIVTIRAFGWQKPFDEKQFQRLNDSQRPLFILACIQRWLSLVLGLLIAGMAVLLIALALCIPQASSGGALGVALNSILAFNMSLTMLISAWTNAETSLGSVARTESFEKYTPVEEEPATPLEPPPSWPTGAVAVENVGFTYADGTIALQNVSFHIPAGQKFAIVGRTGSGKSTLLSSLLRLIDPDTGSITIDNLPLSSIPRSTVRDRLICLPQDALVFPGTIAFNLDPENRCGPHAPQMMQAALQSVNLVPLIESRGGLTADLKPDSLSHGEQQLLALSRAILRKRVHNGNCILVLDEATSNLDAVAEGVVQKVVKEEFRWNTVITVAHRLDTIRDSDMVLMLDKGGVFMVGTPGEVWPLMGVVEGAAVKGGVGLVVEGVDVIEEEKR